MRYGHLTFNHRTQEVHIEWDSDTKELASTLSQGGRGMELSDLKVFDGYLHSVTLWWTLYVSCKGIHRRCW